ncbi:hypothetical protein [Solitalea longa]|uniref:hypothetical protein n=1 Tax=Solitalea longa TaxID=2079460 RepID=UPI0013FDAE90|nr:hypothetical protein [Solitalea longa]
MLRVPFDSAQGDNNSCCHHERSYAERCHAERSRSMKHEQQYLSTVLREIEK